MTMRLQTAEIVDCVQGCSGEARVTRSHFLTRPLVAYCRERDCVDLTLVFLRRSLSIVSLSICQIPRSFRRVPCHTFPSTPPTRKHPSRILRCLDRAGISTYELEKAQYPQYSEHLWPHSKTIHSHGVLPRSGLMRTSPSLFVLLSQRGPRKLQAPPGSRLAGASVPSNRTRRGHR